MSALVVLYKCIKCNERDVRLDCSNNPKCHYCCMRKHYDRRGLFNRRTRLCKFCHEPFERAKNKQGNACPTCYEYITVMLELKIGDIENIVVCSCPLCKRKYQYKHFIEGRSFIKRAPTCGACYKKFITILFCLEKIGMYRDLRKLIVSKI